MSPKALALAPEADKLVSMWDEAVVPNRVSLSDKAVAVAVNVTRLPHWMMTAAEAVERILEASAPFKLELEKTYQEQLHRKLGGQREVIVYCGRIDLLTADRIIEVKRSENWMAAIGQVLAYSTCVPGKPVIALFGSRQWQAQTEHVCKRLGVEVIWL